MVPRPPSDEVPADPTDHLVRRAVRCRPDLQAALTDGGWFAVRIRHLLLTGAGLAFDDGELALARPAVARHASDFVVFSEQQGGLVGLRHGEHFDFADEDGPGRRRDAA